MSERLKILTTAEDVTEEILRQVESTVDWFPEGEPMPVDDFLDRLCRSSSSLEFNLETGKEEWVGWDIDNLDNPAVRKIMRHARAFRKERDE